ncbi:MAG: ATP synthase F0 subunit C [Planctomycetota bacterium]|jgi:F-type H+-transporting ATPase subunit c
MSPFVAVVISIGFALALAAMVGAMAQSKAIAAALDGMARQPEAADKIQTAMIIGLALIESLVIYVLVIAFILNGHASKLIEMGPEILKVAG